MEGQRMMGFRRVVVGGAMWLAMGWLSVGFAMDGAEPKRAIWLWSQHGFPMLDSSALSTASLDFLQQKDIGTIYLYADQDSWHRRNLLVNEPAKYQSFIAGAHSRGMEVFALFGDDGRDTEELGLPERRDDAVTMFQNMLDYNTSVAVNERFDGANLDIEPYLQAGWDNPPQGMTQAESRHLIATQYLDVSAVFMQMKQQYLNDLGQDAPAAFPVGPSTPFWFETITDIAWDNPLDAVTGPVSKPLHEHVLDVHDYRSLLDYRDFAFSRDDRGDGVAVGRTDGIVFLAQEELAYADSIDKPVVIALETVPVSPAYVSFREDSAELLEQELALARASFENQWPDTFAGFALHDFIWYQRLLNEGPFIIVPEPSAGVLWFCGAMWWSSRRRSVRGHLPPHV
jgi:hypothetical protein